MENYQNPKDIRRKLILTMMQMMWNTTMNLFHHMWKNMFQINRRNPSLRLATKARACKGANQE
jgi:hypothetical protein